jgi:hypothetical protein
MPLYIEPNAGPAPIVHLIKGTHRELDIGVYYLDDRAMLAAVHYLARCSHESGKLHYTANLQCTRNVRGHL